MGIFQQQKALDRLEDRLRKVEIKCDDCERTNRKLELEFTELYDKVRHQMSRMAKRAAVNDKENGHDLKPPAPVEPEYDTDPISASILRRRGIRRQAG